MVLFDKNYREFYMRSFETNKRTVIITGASGGFGSELTKLFINEHGCRVIGIGRSREKMEALSDCLGGNKSKFKYSLFDVSERKNWTKFASLLKEKNITPDLLINNAGIMPRFEKFELEDGELAKRIIDTNLMAVIYGCEALIPLLKQSKQGGIVNIASSAAFSPVAGTAVYSASKGAVKNFTMALCEEEADSLYVGCVFPGFSKTDLFRDNEYSDKDFEFISGLGTDKADIAKGIIKGISAGRKLIVCGKDSYLMNVMSSVAPSSANKLYTKVLKSSELEMFKDI